MTDIKELVDDLVMGSTCRDSNMKLDYVLLCQRFLAAYLAEQEPVAWITKDGVRCNPLHTFAGPTTVAWEVPLFTAPPEPAPIWKDISGRCGGHNGEYDHQCLKCGYITWFASYTDPNKENVACPKCHADPEPAPQQTGGQTEREVTPSACPKGQSASMSAVCAAPSSEEVREMVERLRSCAEGFEKPWQSDYAKAADMIERLAAIKQWKEQT